MSPTESLVFLQASQDSVCDRMCSRARIHTRTEQLMCSLHRTHKLVFSSVITLTILLLNIIQLK